MKTPVSGLLNSQPMTMVKQVMEEIANLEVQVMYLETHLLCLYQRSFYRHLTQSKLDATLPKTNVSSIVTSDCTRMSYEDQSCMPLALEEQQHTLGSGSCIHRTHSSLSRHSAYPSSPLLGKVADALHSYHSLPLKMLESATGEASNYVVRDDSCQNRQTANGISEEMIKCISAIYCKLAPNSKTKSAFSSPVVSSKSLMSYSTSTEFHFWSPHSKMNSTPDLHSDISFHGGFEGFSGPYPQMVEVLQIVKDSAKMREIDPVLKKFNTLVRKLEEINPSRLKHEEKLAFWINVHNALAMHAYLVYGISQFKLKRVAMLLKAAYNVGGHTVSVCMMQNFILGCRLPFLGQWLLQLFHRNRKSRNTNDGNCLATDHPEPLSYFALSCGSRSDPPVRVYTPKRVYQELIAAREDYIVCNNRINKEVNKVLLPKIVEIYVKDSGLHPADFRAILDQILPVDLPRNKGWRYHWLRKGQKGIGWIPHDFSFRYQFQNEQQRM